MIFRLDFVLVRPLIGHNWMTGKIGTRLRQFGMLLLLASCILPLHAQKSLETTSEETATPLREEWKLQSACKLQADGASISTEAFHPKDWLATSVPATVVAAQVAAGVLPPPYYGTNLRNFPGMTYPVGGIFARLPMSPDSPYHCGWWYRKEFMIPAADKGKILWLHFGGINYRADIWLNGKKIADKSEVAGAYRTYDFDITAVKPDEQAGVVTNPQHLRTKRFGGNGVIFRCPIFPVLPLVAATPTEHDENSLLVGELEKIIRFQLAFEANGVQVHIAHQAKFVAQALRLLTHQHVLRPPCAADKNRLAIDVKESIALVGEFGSDLPYAELDGFFVGHFPVDCKAQSQVLEMRCAHRIRPPDLRIADLQLRELVRCECDGLILVRGEVDVLLDADTCDGSDDSPTNGLVR
jgi:hypothetical protein